MKIGFVVLFWLVLMVRDLVKRICRVDIPGAEKFEPEFAEVRYYAGTTLRLIM